LVIGWHKQNLFFCELLDPVFIAVHEVFKFVLAKVLKLVDREDLHLAGLGGCGPLVIRRVDLVAVPKKLGFCLLGLFIWWLWFYKKTVDCLLLCFELGALKRMNSPSWLLRQVWGSVKWLPDTVEFGLAPNSIWKWFNAFCRGLVEALLSQVHWFSVVILNRWLRLWISTYKKTDFKFVIG